MYYDQEDWDNMFECIAEEFNLDLSQQAVLKQVLTKYGTVQE